LDGRSVIVTGGSKGIGKGIAASSPRPAGMSCSPARDEDTLKQAADDLAADASGRVETVVADVSVVADCRRIAETAQRLFGGIDVLCANAGVFPRQAAGRADRRGRRRGLRLQRQGHHVRGAGLPAGP
jgi:3-oxoacyl-[acyl-carrier protein] reductase